MVILPRVPDDPDKAQDKRYQKSMGRIYCFIFWNENNVILDQHYPRQSIDNWIYYCYWCYYGRNLCINMWPANDCPKGGSTSIHDCFNHNCTCCLSWYIGRDYIYWYLCRILHSNRNWLCYCSWVVRCCIQGAITISIIYSTIEVIAFGSEDSVSDIRG